MNSHFQEHVILVWRDESPEFHNILALQCKDRVQGLMEEYLSSLPEGECQQAPQGDGEESDFVIVESMNMCNNACVEISQSL